MTRNWRHTLGAAIGFTIFSGSLLAAQGTGQPVLPATPADVKPASISGEDVPYPYPVSYLPLTMYGQDVRIAYMDVAPVGPPNGHTAVLLHGLNFGGFYWASAIDVLRKEGFRVIVPDQVGFGRSSKVIIPYNFNDMALNTRRILQHLNIPTAAIVGHSMGGMLAARFAALYPDMTERVVLYNPIGLVNLRYYQPWVSTDETYQATLKSTYQTVYALIARYFPHKPSLAPLFEPYIRMRYASTLSGDWPRYAMVQTLLSQVQYLDPVVEDWAHIKAPTFVFGGAEDRLPPPGVNFRDRMKFVADSIPNGNGRLQLIPGVGHVAHVEAPDLFYPPLVAFLKEGLPAR